MSREDTYVTKRALRMLVSGYAERGRRKKIWMDCVNENCLKGEWILRENGKLRRMEKTCRADIF